MSPSKKPNQKPYQKQVKKPTKKPPALGQSHTKPWVRVVIVLIVVVLGLGSVAALFFDDNDDGGSDVSTGSSTTTTTLAALASAAGKPCVPLADPLPTGVAEIPLTVGPPPTELVSKDLKVGTGATVEASSTLTLNYVGVSCSTGKIFDSSFGKGAVTYPLAQFVPGWQQGLLGVKAGGTRLLGIPPDLAYGDQGSPPVIAPGETLWFVVEVQDVKPT